MLFERRLVGLWKSEIDTTLKGYNYWQKMATLHFTDVFNTNVNIINKYPIKKGAQT